MSHQKKVMAYYVLAALLVWSVSLFSCAKSKLPVTALRSWKIVVSPDAIPSERYAAEEFQTLFRQGTGWMLPITTEADSGGHHIFIGFSHPMARSDAGFSTRGMGEEALRIRIRPDNMAIAGGRPRGTLYGVYEFFERELGARFLMANVTYFPPKLTERAIPCEDYHYQPVFLYRNVYFGEVQGNPKFATRLRVNTVTDSAKYGGRTEQQLINHSFYKLLPVEKYGKTHPEYYALVKGERLLKMWGHGPQLDVSNPEVVRLVTQAVLQEFKEHPDWRNVSVSQNDNDYYCHCDSCNAINQREGTPMGAQLRFVNEVAARVAKVYPNKKIGTLAYWYTRKPPKHLKPRNNVQIQLADIECCRLHPINDPQCPKNKSFYKDFLGWSKITKNLYIWTYATDFRFFDLPTPNLKSIGANLKVYAAHHVKGVFEQGDGHNLSAEMSDLRNYVIARCLWNPRRDSWQEAREFCRMAYGKAAPIIWNYLKFEHDWVNRYGDHPTCFAFPKQLGLNRTFALKAFDYFHRALKAAENETIRRRVEKISLTAYRTMLEAGAEFVYKDGRLKREYPPGYEHVVEQYIALAKKYHLTSAGERHPFPQFEKRLRTDYLQGIPAVKLENAVWKLIVTPKNNGKMVVMEHKPDGRQLLQMLPNNFMYGAFDEVPGKYMDLSKLKIPFKANVKGDTLFLVRRLTDGSVYQRAIWLTPAKPGTIFCRTTIRHNGTKPGTYQLVVHPEFYTGTTSPDSKILSAYVRFKGKWVCYNEGLNADQGPGVHWLVDAKDGGAHAYFNHKDRFGVLETYDPSKIEKLRTWWVPDEALINLELQTRKVTLKKGERFSFTYAFQYLTHWPPEGK
ncbi:MAG: DUF4838 domain-containing protein [Calditrichaeota bacterium]|nr:DUF4838 domain-containing protein [Calditrichota bacterium]